MSKDETPVENKEEPIVDQPSDWGNETTLIEPELASEDGQKVDRNNLTIPTQAELDAEQAEEEPETKEEIKEEVKTPTAPPVPAAPDPGEFTPADYSFEVSIKGKTTKVSTVEEADALAEDPENFETPQQLMDFMRKANRMENGLERDKAAWEKSKSEFDKQQELTNARAEEINSINAEMNYLVEKGDMPAVAKEYLDADWSDPQVAAQPGVREQIALLRYMADENTRREKAGLKSRLSALDAYNGWKIEEAKVKAAKDKTSAGEQRRAAGAKIAGSSPAPVSGSRPKGIAIGRGGNLNDLGIGWEI